jgi:hypothetical protein
MDHPTWADMITAIASVVSAAGIVLLAIQVILYKKELRDDHERSRRENAINFLLEWAKGLGKNGSLTRKLVELLDEDQIKALVEMRPFAISVEHKNLVLACLDKENAAKSVKIENELVYLSEIHVKIIKWEAVSYLNLLESILSAWRHNTADRLMIEEQFRSFIAPERNMTMLENYRIEAGGHKALPAISEFVSAEMKRRATLDLEEKQKKLKEIEGLPPIGFKH